LQFSEALQIARGVNELDEAALILDWWAAREAAAGCLPRAIDLATEALAFAVDDGQIFLEIHIAGWALALGHFDQAAPHARRAFELSLRVENPALRAYAMVYCASFQAETNPIEAAMVFGYATHQLEEYEWETDSDDDLAINNVELAIRQKLDAETFTTVAGRGSGWTEAQAIASLTAAISTGAVSPSHSADPNSSLGPCTTG
jgi:hypothetical protein